MCHLSESFFWELDPEGRYKNFKMGGQGKGQRCGNLGLQSKGFVPGYLGGGWLRAGWGKKSVSRDQNIQYKSPPISLNKAK